MADDLKLEIVIQALLDAKGFEEAKQNLEGLTGATNKAGDAADKAGKKQKGLGESFGGTRGPVADVTRVLLMNVGVTGAAGEAAKAAGTAMYFMEGAASATAVALTGGVAALALFVPKIIEWLSNTKEQNKEQKDLLATMTAQIPILEKYAAQAKIISDATAIQLQAARGAELKKQAEEIATITAEVARLEPLLREAYAAGLQGQALTKEYGGQATRLVTLKARLDDLRRAQNENLTVEKMYEGQIEKKSVPALTAKTKAVEKLTDAQELQAKQEIDGILDPIRITARTDKQRKKAADEETQRILDYEQLLKSQMAIEAEVAAQKRAVTTATIGYIGQGLAALSAAFGGNKALAIAGAIADTWAGVAGALADVPYPANIAAAASVAATGLAAVMNIRKADPGTTGFDDPFADMTARKLGQRSAVDFVRNFAGSFTPGVIAGMGAMGGSTNNTTINRGTTINMGGIHGALGPRPAFDKWLERAMVKATRARSRTTMGR